MAARVVTATVGAGGDHKAYVLTGGARKKAHLQGLVDRQGKVRAGAGGPWDIVVEFSIATICPTPGGPIDMGPVKAQMDAATAAGARRLRLRPISGTALTAPWFARFGKATLFDPQSGAAVITTPNTCDPAYQAEMDRIDAAIAAVLEPDPRVCEVFAMHRFGFQFSNEFCIHNLGDSRNAPLLAALGWTAAVDQANIMRVLPQLVALYPTTWVNVWVSLDYQNPDLHPVQDTAFTNAFFAKAASLGVTCGIDNSDLSTYDTTPPDIYVRRDAHQAPGTEAGDQTATEAKVGGAPALVTMFTQPYLGRQVAKVRSQEMPSGWRNDLSDAQAAAAQAVFKNAWPDAT